MYNTEKDPLGIILDLIFKRKLIIIIGFLSIFSVIIASVTMIPRTYQAHAKLYIGKPSMPRGVRAPYLHELSDRYFIENQKQIIRGRTIYARVVKKLNLHMVKKEEGTVYKIKKSIKNIIGMNKEALSPLDVAIEQLKETTSVRFSRGSNIVSINAVSRNPEMAAIIANTIADTYMDYSNSLVTNKASNAYQYIEEQVRITREKMEAAEKKLNEHDERDNKLMLGDEERIVSAKVWEVEEQIQILQTQLNDVNRAIQLLANKGGSGSVRRKIRHSSTDPNLINKRNELDQLERQLELALANFTEEHPDVKILKIKIRKKKKEIERYVAGIQINDDANDANDTDRKNKEITRLKYAQSELETKRKELLKRKGEYTAKQSRITQKLSTYIKLKEKYQIHQKRLNKLNSELDEARILTTNEIGEQNVRIVEPAYPPIYTNSSRKVKIIVAAGFLFACIFGLGTAFFVEYIDDSIKGPYMAEEIFDLPVLGIVPKVPKKELIKQSK